MAIPPDMKPQFAWLDALLAREIQRLRARYQLSLDEFRGLYISDAQVDDIFARAAAHENYQLAADLDKCTLSDEFGLSIPFEVELFRRHCLLHGLDDVGLTLEHEGKIGAYERAHATAG